MAVDAADRTLEALVHPPDWQNPRPQRTYDIVVIGGGTAGLVSAVGAAGLGARVAIVERQQLGGDCLITGCVPSKAILRAARAVGELRRAGGLGVHATGVDLNFAEVMTRMRQRRAGLAVNDSAERLRGLGIDMFFADASFISTRELVVGSATLRFTRAAISVPLSEVDRAVLDDETEGFVRVHHARGQLLGCTIVAAHAGEMIGLVSYAIAHGATLNDFASTVYPYPTQAEALRKAGDAYRRTRLTPRVRSAFERYFRITRW